VLQIDLFNCYLGLLHACIAHVGVIQHSMRWALFKW